MRTARRHGACLLLVWLALAGCGAEPDSPEQQIRAWLAAGETAIQEHRLDAAKDLVSPDYRDEGGRGRRELMQLLAVQLLRNQRIHLYLHVDDLSVDAAAGGQAQVVLRAAMAGSPITGLEQLTALRVDLYRFELALVREGDRWLLRAARWQRVAAEGLPR